MSAGKSLLLFITLGRIGSSYTRWRKKCTYEMHRLEIIITCDVRLRTCNKMEILCPKFYSDVNKNEYEYHETIKSQRNWLEAGGRTETINWSIKCKVEWEWTIKTFFNSTISCGTFVSLWKYWKEESNVMGVWHIYIGKWNVVGHYMRERDRNRWQRRYRLHIKETNMTLMCSSFCISVLFR